MWALNHNRTRPSWHSWQLLGQAVPALTAAPWLGACFRLEHAACTQGSSSDAASVGIQSSHRPVQGTAVSWEAHSLQCLFLQPRICILPALTPSSSSASTPSSASLGL